MSIVTLFSGGLDSTLIAVFNKEENIDQKLLFIDYGQICSKQEWDTCTSLAKKLNLPKPNKMDLSGFGNLIKSGLTSKDLNINKDAFLPCRNLLFLLAGVSFAYQNKFNSIAIGLLSEESHLFPDQTSKFTKEAEQLFNSIIFDDVNIITPLIDYSKADVLTLCKQRGISGTRSCHNSTSKPCGICISCEEIQNAQKEIGE